MSALPLWKQSPDGGWYCDDSVETFLGFRASRDFGFDLIDYDRWLRDLTPCPARDELLRIRTEAKSKSHTGELKRLLHFLWASRQAIEHEAELEPHASKRIEQVARLRELSPEGVKERKKQAAEDREKKLEGIAALENEGNRMRKANPTMLTKEIRERLLAVPWANKRMVRAVKIAPRRKSLPPP